MFKSSSEFINAFHHQNELWIFAYGSLMWNPGFKYRFGYRGLVKGYHRSFCLKSSTYRGTPDRPGLVLGLNAGGSCLGVTFHLLKNDIRQTLSYLWRREMLSMAYKPTLVPVFLSKTKRCQALTFVIDPSHPNYYPTSHNLDKVADHIHHAKGVGGSNLYYLEKTVSILKDLNLEDKDLFALLDLVYKKRNLRQKTDDTLA